MKISVMVMELVSMRWPENSPSPKQRKFMSAPGNAATSAIASNLNIQPSDIKGGLWLPKRKRQT